MNTKFKTAISIILVVIFIIASGVIWFRFFASKPVSSQPVAKVSAGGEDAGSKSLLLMLESLQGLEFDFKFIAGPLYRSLKDFTPDIVEPEIKGRPNPFAPFAR